MLYALLAKGDGEGCECSIACNKDYMIFEAEDMEEAEAVAAEYIRGHGKENFEECTIVHFSEYQKLDLQSELYDSEEEEYVDIEDDNYDVYDDTEDEE